MIHHRLEHKYRLKFFKVNDYRNDVFTSVAVSFRYVTVVDKLIGYFAAAYHMIINTINTQFMILNSPQLPVIPNFGVRGSG